MFIIKTFVGPSAIHGNGVFSCEDLPAGEVVWRFHPPFDQVLSDSEVAELPLAAQNYLEIYAYRCLDLGGKLVLSGDHARFLNHSDDSNTEEKPFFSIARKPIAAGEEITCDYGAFCADWSGLEMMLKASLMPVVKNQFVPHRNLYTRLRASAHGIGVFALREIPKNFRLFEGDCVAAVRVPQNIVDRIQDDELRQMYVDFCPLRNGHFIAPTDFNQLTMSWYMNHSEHANVTADDDLQFTSVRSIAKDEELTIDYTSLGHDATHHIASWKR
jgi:uncharacterized protein